jgi:hypothetical protein
MRKPADLAAAMEAIAAAVAQGTIAPAEASELSKVIDTFANAHRDSRLRQPAACVGRTVLRPP